MESLGWREASQGGIVADPGNAVELETGSWRVLKPILDLERCVHCMICWVFCPDSSFIVEQDKLLGIDYDHCKGCGICAKECPKKCIEMVHELSDLLKEAV